MTHDKYLLFMWLKEKMEKKKGIWIYQKYGTVTVL